MEGAILEGDERNAVTLRKVSNGKSRAAWRGGPQRGGGWVRDTVEDVHWELSDGLLLQSSVLRQIRATAHHAERQGLLEHGTNGEALSYEISPFAPGGGVSSGYELLVRYLRELHLTPRNGALGLLCSVRCTFQQNGTSATLTHSWIDALDSPIVTDTVSWDRGQLKSMTQERFVPGTREPYSFDHLDVSANTEPSGTLSLEFRPEAGERIVDRRFGAAVVYSAADDGSYLSDEAVEAIANGRAEADGEEKRRL
ncbi:MAG: hypothetical protein AAF682_27540 [Planctomycetota bacterium]